MIHVSAKKRELYKFHIHTNDYNGTLSTYIPLSLYNIIVLY